MLAAGQYYCQITTNASQHAKPVRQQCLSMTREQAAGTTSSEQPARQPAMPFQHRKSL